MFIPISALDHGHVSIFFSHECNSFYFTAAKHLGISQHEMRHRGEGPYKCTESDVFVLAKGTIHTSYCLTFTTVAI